jgi:predicted ABC-type ATPase
MSGRPGNPTVIVLGGPNGAGKSTSARLLLPEAFKIQHFINADTIAAGLSAFAPETVAFQAGRVMLARLRELTEQRASFAFETTLASRSFAPFLKRLKDDGYSVQLVYIWARSPELSIRRVAERVARGGHFVPDETVRRRYSRGLHNFRTLYLPLADSWLLCDNSGTAPLAIATGRRDGTVQTLNREIYREFTGVDNPDGLSFPDEFFTPPAIENMKRAVAAAVAEHHLVGNPIYIWQDNRVLRSFPDGSTEPVEIS